MKLYGMYVWQMHIQVIYALMTSDCAVTHNQYRKILKYVAQLPLVIAKFWEIRGFSKYFSDLNGSS